MVAKKGSIHGGSAAVENVRALLGELTAETQTDLVDRTARTEDSTATRPLWGSREELVEIRDRLVEFQNTFSGLGRVAPSAYLTEALIRAGIARPSRGDRSAQESSEGTREVTP